ncbi:MAG: LamG domain-containing protein [Myxococcales bacterium]|nr:LamG domain-containing protein [Myxococcales bacterium]
MAAVLLAATACQSDGGDEQDELQALLFDKALTLPVGESAAPPVLSDTPAPAAIQGAKRHVVPLSADPEGVWNLDDCTAARTQLADATSNGNTAYRSVGVTCTNGVNGTLGAKIANREDILYVPDQPSFGLDDGVSVAGWFHPRSTHGTHTLFRKRDSGSSSFALLINHDRYQFVVNTGRRAYSVTSPKKAKTGAFQHVAATYDGDTLRLYVDGIEVDSDDAQGRIQAGPGPLLLGNDGSERRFDGVIDEPLFATHALTAAEVSALLHDCHDLPPAVVVDPFFFIESAPAGSVSQIHIDVFNNDEDLACGPLVFRLETSNPGTGLTVDPAPFTTVIGEPVEAQGGGHFTINVIPDADLPVFTDFFVNFTISEPSQNFFVSKSVQVFTTAPTECHVSNKRELMITDLSVVDDPIRTAFDAASADPRNGAWTFKHLVESMAPTPEQAPAMVEAALRTFLTPLTLNGFTAVPRPNMRDLVLARWPRTANGQLDLARSPMRLNAIVNRMDLRDLSKGNAGEGRFVFAIDDPDFIGFGLRATLIFEYKLPAKTEQDVRDWANAFHALGALPFGETYNVALQALTERFAGRGVRPGAPNGSALNVIRTNDIDLSQNFDIWEMREFRLSPTTGLLVPAPPELTPDVSLNSTTTLASYINANQTSILAEKHTVPPTFQGRPFQAAAVFNELVSWFAPGVNPEARHKFALNTCNGCHGQQETNTRFFMIFPRFAGTEAVFSNYLTGGVSMRDPVTGQARSFSELARRNADLRSLVCPGAVPLSSSPATVAKGASRVH